MQNRKCFYIRSIKDWKHISDLLYPVKPSRDNISLRFKRSTGYYLLGMTKAWDFRVCINRGCEMIGMLVCRLFRFNHRLTAIKKAELTTSTDTLIPIDTRIVQNKSPTLSLDCYLRRVSCLWELKKSIIYTMSPGKEHLGT